jgi:hypothetical protein
LLTTNQLQELFSSREEIKWLSGDITENRRDLYEYLKTALKIDEIRPRKKGGATGFAEIITSSFLENQSDEWMVAFYRFLGGQGQDALWKKGGGRGTWYIPPGPLRNKPFIRLQDGTHVPPFKEDGSPNAYLPPEDDTEFPVVTPEITKDEKAMEFLNNLELNKPNTVDEVVVHIIPKYSRDIPPIFADEHQRDMKKILRAYSEKKQQLINKLKKTAFIYAENPVLQKTAYKEPGKLYLRNNDLVMYFEGNQDVWFVSSKYDISFHDLFKDLGVNDSVRVAKKIPENDKYIVIYKPNKGSENDKHKRGLNGFDPDIEVDGLEYALTHPTIEKSAFVWNTIASLYSDCIRGVVESSTKQTYENSSKQEGVSEFGSLLINTDWLPNKDEKFHKPGKLGLDDLPEAFRRDKKLSDQLEMKEDDLAKLAKKADVPVEDIELLKQYPQEFQKWKASISERRRKPDFPSRASVNPERREERVAEQLKDAPTKQFEQLNRSVRTSKRSIDPVVWLRNQYTNELDQMVCQICKQEMPFKKRDGEYYFEHVEAFDSDVLPKEHEAQFLALCPLCAAMYKEFVKHDEGAMESLKNTLMSSEGAEVSLQLGELDTSIRFVESHWRDIRTILQEMGYIGLQPTA